MCSNKPPYHVYHPLLPPILHAELQKANTEYKEKLEARHASDQTMFSVSWDIEELNKLNNERRSLRTEISAAIDVCNPDTTEQQNLPHLFESDWVSSSEKWHDFVMFQKPYALPVQCDPMLV